MWILKNTANNSPSLIPISHQQPLLICIVVFETLVLKIWWWFSGSNQNIGIFPMREGLLIGVSGAEENY